jgi:hypothetical protein
MMMETKKSHKTVDFLYTLWTCSLSNCDSASYTRGHWADDLDDLDIPAPALPKRGERMVATPVTTALKAAVYVAMREQAVSKSELARRMRVNEN